MTTTRRSSVCETCGAIDCVGGRTCEVRGRETWPGTDDPERIADAMIEAQAAPDDENHESDAPNDPGLAPVCSECSGYGKVNVQVGLVEGNEVDCPKCSAGDPPTQEMLDTWMQNAVDRTKERDEARAMLVRMFPLYELGCSETGGPPDADIATLVAQIRKTTT